mgnify:CR=1 FL=1
MTIRLAYETRAPIAHPNVIVAFVRSDGVAACSFSSEADGVDLGMLDGRGVIELRTPPLSLVAEVYSILVLVREQGFGRVVCSRNAAARSTCATSCSTPLRRVPRIRPVVRARPGRGPPPRRARSRTPCGRREA